MAYTATVTKQNVTKLNESDYQVTIHVMITNDITSEVILEKDYSERYYSALDVVTIRSRLQQQILDDWNKYIAEQNIYNRAVFDSMVSDIQTVANTYINP